MGGGVEHNDVCDNADRGDGGGGDNAAEPGDTEPDEHGVEPPQYLINKELYIENNTYII